MSRLGLSVEYTHNENGHIVEALYVNGTRTTYDYDDAGRLDYIRHDNVPIQPLILQFQIFYSPTGLIDNVDEVRPGVGAMILSEIEYDYDARGRLIHEQRDDTVGTSGVSPVEFNLYYTYDQGGNRLTKLDLISQTEIEYHYDLEDPAEYHSKHNRLMYYEVFDVTDPENPELTVTWGYEYRDYDHPGNVTRVTRVYGQGAQGPLKEDWSLQYNEAGEVWFIIHRTWEDYNQYCPNQEILSVTEFVGSGRGRSFLRLRDPADDRKVLPGGTQWTDYSGDTVYGDYVVEFLECDPEDPGCIDPPGAQSPAQPLVVEKMGYLPGIGQYNTETGAATYFYSDHLGTLRAAITDADGAGEDPPDDPVYVAFTSFGEKVSAMSNINTRYQYVGAWGYETFTDPDGNPETNDPLPFLHVGHRWYDPATGRFLQRDPIGIAGGLNNYTYVYNSPLKYIDPFGLDFIINSTDWIGAVGGIFGAHAAYYLACTMLGFPASGPVIAAAVLVGGLTGGKTAQEVYEDPSGAIEKAIDGWQGAFEWLTNSGRYTIRRPTVSPGFYCRDD